MQLFTQRKLLSKKLFFFLITRMDAFLERMSKYLRYRKIQLQIYYHVRLRVSIAIAPPWLPSSGL